MVLQLVVLGLMVAYLYALPFVQSLVLGMVQAIWGLSSGTVNARCGNQAVGQRRGLRWWR
jgi:tetrahydromethanopterin S-methyltransferase subunit E